MAKGKKKVAVRIHDERHYKQPVVHIIVGEYGPYSNEGIYVKLSEAKRIRKAIKQAVAEYEAKQAEGVDTSSRIA